MGRRTVNDRILEVCGVPVIWRKSNVPEMFCRLQEFESHFRLASLGVTHISDTAFGFGVALRIDDRQILSAFWSDTEAKQAAMRIYRFRGGFFFVRLPIALKFNDNAHGNENALTATSLAFALEGV